jgi:ESF2/ABP1 family protein
MPSDSRFVLDKRFATEPSSVEHSDTGSPIHSDPELDEYDNAVSEAESEQDDEHAPEGMDADNLAGPSKTVKPLTKEALEAYNKAQERTGVIYISRIPPGMRPTKVRHLMGQHGEIGRVYLQQEGASPFFL